MVEMVETAEILHHATSESLIILDEIGRGTSTYDGLSIAWAVAEYLVSHPNITPLTLFATHYHELQTLAEKYAKIKNFQVAVEETKAELIFLHKVIPGGTSHSYGIAVAKLAGVPADVIHRALQVLEKLEQQSLQTPEHKIAVSNFEQMSFLKEQTHPIFEELKKIDPDLITPLEGLKILHELKKQLP
jgi:DNA mismatch repair protein MutS